MRKLQLSSLDKDDSVTPDKMISFCKKLLAATEGIEESFNGTIIQVTTFYSVLSDGTMCLPWSAKLD